MIMRNAMYVSAIALISATPAIAQQSTTSGDLKAVTPAEADPEEIIVTAQREAERLQDVPIAVSAFSAAALETRQIRNSLDLQLSLPNITFTRTNFGGSSFTVRGIGDLCVGMACDAATGVHINDVPVPNTRLFETEFLDLERVEVLRGPQGTLFGRNATSGVINFITARPNLSRVSGSGQVEYGNYDSKKVQGVLNLPLSDTIGIRVAGLYLNRDGYTKNLFNNTRYDGRKLYQLRGSLRFEPTSATTIDLMGSYFREKDDRSRLQKQQCHRDPTGVLGCLPDRLGNDTVNANGATGGIFTSRQFFGTALGATFTQFGLRDLYGADSFAGYVQPTDVRTVNANFNPTFFSDEINAQGRVAQDFGKVAVTLTGGYNRVRLDATTGFYQNIPGSLAGNAGIAAFRNPANPLAAVLAKANATIFDANGNLCSSIPDETAVGVFGGKTYGCSQQLNTDRTMYRYRTASGELRISTKLDGPFNAQVGGIYLDSNSSGSYLVAQSELNYAAAVLGAARSLAATSPAPAGSVYNGPAMLNSETQRYNLKSYGIFADGHYDLSSTVKLTLGVRYSRDEKTLRDRSALFSFLVPYGVSDVAASPYIGLFDADASVPGNQLYRDSRIAFRRVTGRAVIDWKPSDDTLFYASYSRGYKSGGVNPPFDPAVFTAPVNFRPESVDAFELGTKNTVAGGALQINGNAFYYRYKDLQLSRILNRTSFNDNTDAAIYGAELEAVVRPARHFLVNVTASYLKSKIKAFSLVDTRDPSGGRSDTVIIKDITNASNCVVRPTGTGTAAQANAFVTVVNSVAGLRAPTPIEGTNTTGAYGVCSLLASLAQSPGARGAALEAALRGATGTATGSLPFLFNVNAAGVAIGLPDGVPVNLEGKSLPNAPTWKFAVGAQHTATLGAMNLVTRVDLSYTGEFYARSFNRPIDKVQGYEVVNASIQLNGPEDKWFLRGFVQNLTANNATTGAYLSGNSSGLYTNIFTLEPRRYGIAAGFSF